MIQNKKDLKEYIEADGKCYKSAIGLKSYWDQMHSNPGSHTKNIWKYIRLLRHVEYHLNGGGYLHKCLKTWYLYRLRKVAYKTGFQIPPNTIGKGLTIYHWGPIIINGKARLGENCTLYPGVLIGHKEAGSPAPVIGNNVFLASGAKIIGNITIGDNVTVAHNTTVVKDVPANCIVAGSPARIIKLNGVKVNMLL